MVDGVNDERMADYLDEIDRLETTQEMYWQFSLDPATSDRMAWYYIGCASQERRKLEALRRKLQETGNDE